MRQRVEIKHLAASRCSERELLKVNGESKRKEDSCLKIEWVLAYKNLL